jgi:F420-dependent oxidoreductase-like protein
VELAVAAESLGYESVWVPEAYGSDAVTMLAYIAARTTTIQLGSAVLQMAARTPANTAMTAMTLDVLSGGRTLLGLGSSGPQVVEGWHGVPFDHPVGRTREYVELVRAVIRRDGPLSFAGRYYSVPLHRGDAEPRRPLRSSMHPQRPAVPVFIAANGPRNVALTAEIADGWLPSMYVPEHHDVFAPALEEGAERRDPALGALQVTASLEVHIGADLDTCRDAARPNLALYIGGMGSKEQNFYNAQVTRYGYGAVAQEVQELYLSGHRREAEAALPDELIDKIALVGPPEVVRTRLRAWDASLVDRLIVKTDEVSTLQQVRQLADEL